MPPKDQPAVVTDAQLDTSSDDVSTPDWASLAHDVDEPDSGPNIAEPAVVSPADTPKPAVSSAASPTEAPATIPSSSTPSVDTSSVATPQVPPPQAPETPPAQTQQPQVTPAPVSQATTPVQDRPQKSPEQARADMVAFLEKRYALTPDMAAKLITEPEVVFPNLLAQAHMQAVQDAVQIVQQQFPHMVQHQTQEQLRRTETETAFYTRWPQLKGEDKLPAIVRIVSAYRAANQNATAQTVIEEAGAMAVAALGLQAVAPQAPQQTAQSIPVPPAGIGSSAGRAPSQNPFTVIAEEFLEDDR